MFRLTKTNMVIAAFAVGVPVLCFFQNCAQSGTLGLGGTALNANSTSDSLVVAPATPSTGDINLDPNEGEKGSIGDCDQTPISDVLLKINSISTNGENPNEISFELTDPDKSLSLEKLTLKLQARKSEKISNLMLVLNNQGNKILTRDNTVMDLSTPSGQQSGIKVRLESEKDVVAGQSYTLLVSLNPAEQIVTNKNKCLFKPIIKSASLRD